MNADERRAILDAHRREEERLVYWSRIEEAKEYLTTLSPGSEDYQRTAQHIAELEATGKHLKKE